MLLILTFWTEFKLIAIHKKERIWLSHSEKDETRACYTEWNKSKQEKNIVY